MITGVAHRGLTRAEIAREPRSLGVLAWFDGEARAWSPRPLMTYPRRLDRDEAQSWRDGYNEGRQARWCMDAHGFGPHTEECGA